MSRERREIATAVERRCAVQQLVVAACFAGGELLLRIALPAAAVILGLALIA